MFKRFFTFVLVLIMVSVPLMGGAGMVSAASAAEDMEAIVEKQIRAFADSIDQNKADTSAATALGMHGIRGGGKTLKAGKTHALTATLFNSEMLQVALTDFLAVTIMDMQRLEKSALPYVYANVDWSRDGSFYLGYVCTGPGYVTGDIQDYDWSLPSQNPYNGKRNGYDDSLEWIVSGAVLHTQIERTKTTAAEQTYKVTCTVHDRFDFSTSSNSGFKNLISGLGAVLFREFDWESTVTFNLTVPYSCSHSSGMYHWTYDPENCTFTSDSSKGYAENRTTRYSFVSSGVTSYYHELDKPVRLYHDEPWVLEYDVKNPGVFTLAPMKTSSSATRFILENYGKFNLCIRNTYRVKVSDAVVKEYNLGNRLQHTTHRYGTPLSDLFTYNSNNIYAFRLENKVKTDGSNMIYLTVHNADTGELLMDKVPMDDYWLYESWTNQRVLQSESNSALNGKDLYINYFGNEIDRFSADHFELRIWENGEGAENKSYFTTKVTKPTCTAQGYTTYTCSLCGYSYQADKVKANGHSYGEWTVVTAPTCTEAGEEQRTCKTCKEAETWEAAAKGHSYEALVTAPTCIEPGYTTFTCACGDNYVGDDTAPLGHGFEGNVCIACGEVKYAPGNVDMDDDVDVDDVLALLWNVLFPEEYPIEVKADFDGNGTTDVDDVLALLWHVLFPEEYPLN